MTEDNLSIENIKDHLKKEAQKARLTAKVVKHLRNNKKLNLLSKDSRISIRFYEFLGWFFLYGCADSLLTYVLLGKVTDLSLLPICALMVHSFGRPLFMLIIYLEDGDVIDDYKHFVENKK